MKTKSIFLNIVSGIFAIWILLYVLFAFVNFELNPTLWNPDYRTAYLIISLFAAIPTAFGLSGINDEVKK